MEGEEPVGPLYGLPPDAVRPNEVVHHHWAAPGGRGFLTNERGVLLSHPHLVHRAILWERDLEKVESLEVVALADNPEVVEFVNRTLAGGAKWGSPTAGVVNCEFKLLGDEVPVHEGGADKCESIQAWIEEARTARCLVVFGPLTPYRP